MGVLDTGVRSTQQPLGGTEVGARQSSSRGGPLYLGNLHWVKETVLWVHPVALLAVEDEPQGSSGGATHYWENWLWQCPLPSHPDLVTICTDPKELVISGGGGYHSKAWRRKLTALGYQLGFWFLHSTDHGGVVRQDPLVLVLQKERE
jgi:hypothetical protein